MIKSPSLQNGYTLVWSKDPALALPEDDATKTPEENAAERARVLRIARQTGQWPIAPGEQPTVFHFRNLSRSDLSWATGEQQDSSEHKRRKLSGLEVDDLLLRLALVKVENLPGVKVEHGRVGSQKRVATPETIDAIHEAARPDGAALLAELAILVVERAEQQIDPL